MIQSHDFEYNHGKNETLLYQQIIQKLFPFFDESFSLTFLNNFTINYCKPKLHFYQVLAMKCFILTNFHIFFLFFINFIFSLKQGLRKKNHHFQLEDRPINSAYQL